MSFEVETHGAGGLLRGDILHDSVLVGRIFVDDSKVAIAARGKHVTSRGIEGAGIRPIANGRSGNDFAGIRVHHGHNFLVADGKQAAVAEVHGETGRRFARRKRPAVEFLEGLRIEMMELGGVLVVHIDRALAVSDGEFGPAAQSYRADNRAIRGVDRGGVFAAAVEGEDALADGIVDDGVGIRVCFDGAEGLQGLEIEDGYIVRTAVAGEAAAEIGSDGDSMALSTKT